MVAAKPVSCVELLDRGLGCAIVVAAARAFAEPVPPSIDLAKPEAKTVSSVGEIDPRPVDFGSSDRGRKTSDESSRGSREAVNLYTWFVCASIAKIGRGGGRPPKRACSVRGTSPPKAVLSARGARPKPTQIDPWDR